MLLPHELTLTVIDEDIDSHVTFSFDCPVARAAVRALKAAAVDTSEIYCAAAGGHPLIVCARDSTLRGKYGANAALTRWIRRYDLWTYAVGPLRPGPLTVTLSLHADT
jgi:hypothetical protein